MCDVYVYDIIYSSRHDDGSIGRDRPFTITPSTYAIEKLGDTNNLIDNWF